MKTLSGKPGKVGENAPAHGNCLFVFSFLAKRGVKEEICTFDTHSISPEIRASVEELLQSRKNSFDPKVCLH